MFKKYLGILALVLLYQVSFANPALFRLNQEELEEDGVYAYSVTGSLLKLAEKTSKNPKKYAKEIKNYYTSDEYILLRRLDKEKDIPEKYYDLYKVKSFRITPAQGEPILVIVEKPILGGLSLSISRYNDDLTMNVLACTKSSDFRETESTILTAILTNGACAKLLKKANINITEQDVKNAEAIKYPDEK